jgi:serine-type D-Ala-D-Ala carboxypeptidase/endopeptidase (penicillin-binding protein 4)
MQHMWASPLMPEWLGSLPIVGIDGTARRWTGPAAGRAHIKTGSLDGVATMAGVVDGAGGQRWLVVALGQHPQPAALRAWYAQVLGWLAQP